MEHDYGVVDLHRGCFGDGICCISCLNKCPEVHLAAVFRRITLFDLFNKILKKANKNILLAFLFIAFCVLFSFTL